MELCMKHQIFLAFGCATMLLAASGGSSLAQDSQTAKSSQAAGKDASSPKKAHKVWTEDEVSTLRTPEDNYIEQRQAAEAAAAAAATAQQAKLTPKPEKHVGAASALANPKSPADADRMIAWENRDVDAQQELIDKERTLVEQATPETREALEKDLAKHIKMLENTKKERGALVTQKKELEKKAASPDKPVDAASASTPQ
jgi:hypothetical protein